MADWTDNLKSLDGALSEMPDDLTAFGGDGYSEEVYGATAEEPDQDFRFAPRERSWVDLSQVADCQNAIKRLPADGETIHMILSGRYTPFNFVPATIALASAGLDELVLSTLTYSADNAADMLEMFDVGTVKTFGMLVSHWFSHANKHLYDPFAGEMKRRGQRIRVYRTHCKIWLMKTTDGRHFVIEGSCNIRSCKCLENVTFTQSRDLYEFHRGWITRLLDEQEQKHP